MLLICKFGCSGVAVHALLELHGKDLGGRATYYNFALLFEMVWCDISSYLNLNILLLSVCVILPFPLRLLCCVGS